MTPLEGQPILTAAAMRAAEDRAIAAGSSVSALMERAGAGVAAAVARLAGGARVLILCGPGNNGGDGYVAARILRDNGAAVRVAALGEPGSDAARAARAGWAGAVEAFDGNIAGEPVLLDALFGTGLSRGLEDAAASALGRAIDAARLSIAVDLPSHVDTDTGQVFGGERIAPVDVTLALGAAKPSHVLMPAARFCGAVRVVDIGLDIVAADAIATANAQPAFVHPRWDDHKYSRGFVAVVEGAMPGAARMAAEAAARAGAGYVMLFGDDAGDGRPHAIVRRRWSNDALAAALDAKKNAVVLIGPGLGRDAQAGERLSAAIATGNRMVIDGDALHLLDDDALRGFRARSDDAAIVLTPHAGEFAALFGDWRGSKIDATRRAAERAGATVVFKGPDTVIATRDGAATVAEGGSRWLSTAGTGDVLAGAIAAALVNGATGDPAAAGVWMHGEAARRLGGAFIADDLVHALTAVRAGL